MDNTRGGSQRNVLIILAGWTMATGEKARITEGDCHSGVIAHYDGRDFPTPQRLEGAQHYQEKQVRNAIRSTTR